MLFHKEGIKHYWSLAEHLRSVLEKLLTNQEYKRMTSEKEGPAALRDRFATEQLHMSDECVRIINDLGHAIPHFKNINRHLTSEENLLRAIVKEFKQIPGNRGIVEIDQILIESGNKIVTDIEALTEISHVFNRGDGSDRDNMVKAKQLCENLIQEFVAIKNSSYEAARQINDVRATLQKKIDFLKHGQTELNAFHVNILSWLNG